jgi:hypothetical protein
VLGRMVLSTNGRRSMNPGGGGGRGGHGGGQRRSDGARAPAASRQAPRAHGGKR